MQIHVHHHLDSSIQSVLDDISRKLDLILHREYIIMSGEDDLKAAVAALATSVTAVGAKIAQLMSSAAGDPDTDIETLAQQVNAQVAILNQAVSPVVASAAAIKSP